ncbi:winged helix-turn-helix domain-containing protein [Dokdonella sp.]|uniref:winged helix-turn-helix domain-containing protein n=1 Tax=Dokdonella sp. TaxID=2291710 RepID=UPI00262D1370|nr:winged helix-turn-helix domain-containing protein [Dokdonella sp.]
MPHLYRFGDFRLDAATRELRRNGVPVPVPPRAFDCIVYLIEHRDRAVGRDELIAAVWGRADITDGLLGQTVLSARRVLDDTGKEQQCIRTVFRFGYHWVAAMDAVEEAHEDGSDTAATSDEPSPAANEPIAAAAAEPPPQRRFGPWVATVVLLALAASAILFRLGRNPSLPVAAPPQDAARIVLVLPVATSAGSGYDWVRLGVMDLIGARLRAAGVPVVPSDNVVALTRSPPAGGDFEALARTAGAGLVIDAQAARQDGRWRVTLHPVHGGGALRDTSAEAADVLDAARDAADQLARQLGHAPPAGADGGTGTPALGQLLPQVDAAILAERLDVARALIEGAGSLRENPELRLRLAQIDHQAGNLDAAEAGYKAILAATSPERDAVMHARALSNLGVIAAQRDDNALASERFDRAVALLRGEQAPDTLGKALVGRAATASSAHRHEAALVDMAEARIAFESTGNLLALALLDSNLGALDMLRGRYAEARIAFDRSAGRFATFDAHALELNALTGVAELALAMLEPDEALAREPRLRELIGKVSDPARQRNAELTRLQVLAANGRLRTLDEDLARVIDAARHDDDRVALARGQALAAERALARGEPALAAERAAEAASRFTSIADDPHERARIGLLLVRTRLAAGQAAPAAEALAALETFAAGEGSEGARFQATLARAEVAATGNDTEAGKTYAQALAQADATRIPLDLREAAGAYAGWLIRTGDPAQAGATVERIAVWASRDYESALLQLRVHHATGRADLWRIALARVRALAGERGIPADLLLEPAPPRPSDSSAINHLPNH